jgi:parallel beta-helix repeat protein
MTGIMVAPFSFNCIIDSNIISGCTGDGINHNGKGTNQISCNTIENCGVNGIFLSGMSSGPMTVTGNTLKKNGRHGMDMERPDVHIMGNISADNAEVGIRTNLHLQNIIIGDSNHVEGNGEYGIEIESETKATITGNYIWGNSRQGILVWDGGEATISGNTVKGNGDWGIQVLGSAIIRNNTISENVWDGVYNEGSCIIEGNTITANFTGIANRQGAVKTWIGSNRISGNVDHGISLYEMAYVQGNAIDSNGMFGIVIADSVTGVRITDTNLISSNREHGILIGNAASATIMNNTITYNGTGVITWEDFSGIILFGSAHVEGNIIENNHGSGIYATESASNVVIKNNPVINGNREGIVLKSAAIVENNTICNNRDQGVWISRSGEILLKQDTISGNREGITMMREDCRVTVMNCDISGNETGIHARGELKMRRSTIRNNTESGVRILSRGCDLGRDSDSEAGHNRIAGNTPWNIANHTGDSVFACRNYWELGDTHDIHMTIWDIRDDFEMGPVIIAPVINEDATGIGKRISAHRPDDDRGSFEAFPNPFREETVFSYTLATPGRVTLRIFDMRGNLVAGLVNCKYHEAGHYTLRWDSCSGNGIPAAKGVYIATLQAGVKSCARLLQVTR